MRKAIVAASLLAVLVAAGCNTEKKRLEGELATATARISELEQSVVQSGLKADSLADSLRHVEKRGQTIRDSLSDMLHAAVTKSQRLEANLQSARDKHRRTIDSLGTMRATLESTINEHRATVASLESQLTMAQGDAEKYRGQRDSLLAFVDDLRPWYDYYKHEAGRNWAKKLFGAGHGKKPTTAEPAFRTPPAPELEAGRP
jgi:chromosome segregation ATPase